MEPTHHDALPTATRAVLVSSAFCEADTVRQLGREAYSYRFVYRAFAPLLERWGRTSEVDRPASRLDFALRQARREGLDPVHLSFLPLHLLYPTAQAPNVAFPFWEFPDIPDTDFGNTPRNNWARIAGRLDLLLTASNFTRDAFVRAGVRTPVHVVPVPVRPDYFAVPAWQPDQRVVLDCPCYVFPPADTAPPREQDPWQATDFARLSFRQRLRYAYLCYLRPRLPNLVDQTLTQWVRARRVARERLRVLYAVTPRLELSGVVYTTILNPFDWRKNFDDILKAYLLALRDCAGATLVVKLVVCPQLAARSLNAIIRQYQSYGIPHRCRLVFVTDYLSDAQMVDLARASTFYLNGSHAEGACLPLQDFLAAGRPGIAPDHTAMADYFHGDLGFVVASHPEPTYWPHDPDQHLTTTWHRIVWQSLHDQIRASYTLARENQAGYERLAANGRAQIRTFAGAESVWPRLRAALDSLDGCKQSASAEAPRFLRQAS
jgi:glycosyltransferase involved in cell wall biosynthesis